MTLQRRIVAVCHPFAILLALLFLAVVTEQLQDTPCSKVLKIMDDERLDKAVSDARSKFLATRPHPFDRLTSTVLIPSDDGTFWTRGSFDQNRVEYPASCVKLAYMVSAIKWCLSQGRDYDCLDYHVRPMIMISDNLETGVVVDFITGAPNLPNLTQANATYFQWLSKRNFTQQWMSERDLLQNQRVLHKTYPTNSGDALVGAEKLAREREGSNQMNTKCTASLMAEIVSKKLHPEAQKYMMGLLYHPHTSYTSYGSGLPPGAILYSKIGNAYDTLEEISYILLPNGKSFVVSTFTNGYEPSEPTINNLAYYIELLIDNTGLGIGLPGKLIFDTSSDNFFVSGAQWQIGEKRDMYGSSYMYTTDLEKETAGWNFKIQEDGMYEVSVWNPELSEAAPDALFSIKHAQGVDTARVNQRVNGGRWIKLGDFTFNSGSVYSVTVTAASGSGTTVVVNALKLTKWPNCGDIPASSCLLFK